MNTFHSSVRAVARVACFCVLAVSARAADWWPATVDAALDRAGTNRAEIVRALNDAPPARRDGLQFLVENMPDSDLRLLSADFLGRHVALAYDGFARAPWRSAVPSDIFLNDILPYACISEVRDNSAEVLAGKCAPLVADCATPSAAARRLNEKLFDLVNVHYNTHRPFNVQSPLQAMSCGMSTCTGLSILLVDACRAVGVPARVAGIPNWVDNRGNHTWVEIWDGGWHFVGASEPDAKGLDHAWFENDAARARRDEPEHAIYASSFKRTALAYPLDWGVSVVNVTDRYAAGGETAAAPNADRIMITVVDKLGGHRVAAHVTLVGLTNATLHWEGFSRDETNDLNSVLEFAVPRGPYLARATWNGVSADREVTAGTNRQVAITLSIADTPVFAMPSWASNVVTAEIHPLKHRDATELTEALTPYFAASASAQATWKFPASLDKLLLKNEPAVREAAWEAYKAAPIHDAARQDYDAKVARFTSYVSPYTLKTVGTRPAHGWPLFIAMHGGGGAPKELNDSQWEIMQRYYRDQPQAGGYLYVALRAPNDTWNGFYDVYIYPLIDNLIRQFTLFGDVDPNKVFIMGYSHGGYGAFAIGPKEPDLFAAIHVSAGAPTDGETVLPTLRHTVFTLMVGENDTAYDRIIRDRKFRDSINELRGGRTDIYPTTVKIIPGHGHSGLPDRGMIAHMYNAVRQPTPPDITWLMSDEVITDFFWLHTATPGKYQEIDAAIAANHITVTTTNVATASVLLDTRLVDFSKPITLTLNGATTKHDLHPSLLTLCETLLHRGDPNLAFTAELPLPISTTPR